MIATVLLATAISVTETRSPIPSFAVFLPIINFWICSISHCIPPALEVKAAKPPDKSDNRNISFIPKKPLYTSFERERKEKSLDIIPIKPEIIIPLVRTIKTFKPLIAITKTVIYGKIFKRL